MKRFFHGRNLLFLGVGSAALVIALVLILVSVIGSSSAETTPTTPTTTETSTTGSPAPSAPAKAPGAAATAALFHGIPQQLNQLGNAKAKVTMVEFADPQCPYCRQYALETLPTLVREYVRTGKAKLVLFGIPIIGTNSEQGLRATYAAGLQNKLWNFSDLLYKSQGAENSGWITDDLLRRIGNSIPGFDTNRMFADMQSDEVNAALSASAQQASSARVDRTPTFFAGPTGGRLEQLPITALTPDAFRPALDALLK
ncbi:MAG TPA: thioredoxin domain-containing protein [Gaiellaceae bacterium]|jgi:protein-disulfide isomerase